MPMSCKRKRRPNRRHSHKKRHTKRTTRKKHIGRRKQRGGTLEKCMAECTASCSARFPKNMRKPNKNGWYIETEEGQGGVSHSYLCNTHWNNPERRTTNNCISYDYTQYMDALPPPNTKNVEGYVTTVIDGEYYWTKDGHNVKITKENANWNMSSADLDADEDEDPFGVSDEALARFLSN